MKLTKEQKRRERKRRFKAAKAWLADHWQFNEADAQAKRPGQEILKEDVYQTYLTYCTKDNVDPVANSIFGKALHRVFPGVKSVRKGPRGKAKHHYKYLTQREDIPEADTTTVGAPDATLKSVRKIGGARRKMHMRKKNLNWKTVNNPASTTTKLTAGSKRTSAEMEDTSTSPSSLRSFACSSASISDSRGNSHSNKKRSKTEGMSNPCISSTQRTVSSTMNLPLRRSSRKRKAIEIQDEEESEEEEVELTATVQAKKKKRTTRILTDTPPSTTTTSATRYNTTITNQEASDEEQPEKGIFGPCGMHSSVPDHQNSNLEFLVKFLDKFDEKKDNNPAHLEKEDAAEAEYPRQATSPYVYTTTTTHHSYHYPHQQLLDADTQSQNTFPKRKRDSSSSVHSSTVLETSPTLHDSMDEYYFVSPPLHEEYSDSCTQGFQTNNLWPSSWCSKLWQEIADMKGRYLRYLDSLRRSFVQCCSRGDLEDCRIVVFNFWQDEASRDTYHLFEDSKLRATLLAAEEDFFCSLVSDTATFDRHFILDFASHMDDWIQQLVLSQVFRADLLEYYRAFSKQVQTHVLYDSDSLFQTRPFIPAHAQLLYSSTSPSASSSFSMPCDSYASMQAFQVRESRGEEEYALWSV